MLVEWYNQKSNCFPYLAQFANDCENQPDRSAEFPAWIDDSSEAVILNSSKLPLNWSEWFQSVCYQTIIAALVQLNNPAEVKYLWLICVCWYHLWYVEPPGPSIHSISPNVVLEYSPTSNYFETCTFSPQSHYGKNSS